MLRIPPLYLIEHGFWRQWRQLWQGTAARAVNRYERERAQDGPDNKTDQDCRDHATFSARAISLARKISSAVTFAIGMSGAQYRSGMPLLCHL